MIAIQVRPEEMRSMAIRNFHECYSLVTKPADINLVNDVKHVEQLA
jgi:hypothetical protein